MRLLVISHTRHYKSAGKVYGWGPTVREIDWLAGAFDRVTHLACIHSGPPPASALPYCAKNVRTVLVPPAGGLAMRDKAKALSKGPEYIKMISACSREADVIHVRAPAPISLYALLLLGFSSGKPRWIKYAGNWGASGRQPLSFRFQRFWLRTDLSQGPVTINGTWPDQPAHVYTFHNPSLSLSEIESAREAVRMKELNRPVRLVYAGRLEKAKGVDIVIRVLGKLHEQAEARLEVIGDGPERPKLAQLAEALGVTHRITFWGWLPPEAVKKLLAESHFVLLPSSSEGWPKILSEGMAYGAVPVASRVSAIPQVLEAYRAGLTCDPSDVDCYAGAILDLLEHPDRWRSLVRSGLNAARDFTFEKYILALDELFVSYYGVSPLNQVFVEYLRDQVERSTKNG